MELDEKKYDYETFKKHGTGSQENFEEYKIVECVFDRYLIKVKLTPKNEFMGIVEIKVNKDFLSHEQKITPKGFHDIDEFYKE